MANITKVTTGEGWQPGVGDFFQDFSERLRLSPEARALLAADTVALLGQCADPRPASDPVARTGLVTGYVQSGKTRSIESVLSVARDSGYQMAIVLTGTSNPLLVQSKGRLERDLGIFEGVSELGWTSIFKPGPKQQKMIAGLLASWTDGRPDWERQTPLLAVLKNASNINKLADLLGAFSLASVPVMVIDDEADQASLDNNARRANKSPTATYLSIERLRASLPRHTYLQYTATPQAPLLVSITDSLSPEFVHVLVPAEGYTGGQTFFGDAKPFEMLREIDPRDLSPVNATQIPATLKRAFRQFIVGVAAGIAPGVRPDPRNRSMFVHPSRLRDPHEQYEAWLGLLKDEWSAILKEPESSKERTRLIEEFRTAYDDLSSTGEIVAFDLIVGFLHSALTRTNIQVVNGKNQDEVRWKTTYPWILIGGQSLDRGFTVEGATVSYMPRPIGQGNADNFQQRARFFGYRAKYLSLTRVYMDAASIVAFGDYVEHEEIMRGELMRVQNEGIPLRDWKRLFLLDASLAPTRMSVIANGYLRVTLRGWQYPKWPHLNPEQAQRNNAVLMDYLNRLTPVELDGYPRHSAQKGVPLDRVLERLSSLEYPLDSDSRHHTATMLALRFMLDQDPEQIADVYLMDQLKTRVRSVHPRNGGVNPLQGKNPAGGDKYPGDDKMRNDDRVSIQIHNLEIATAEGTRVQCLVPVIRLPEAAVKTFVHQISQ
ncbi:hypothetical protein BH09ACT4_BH09ACT4_10730 [soil metagenome]